MGLWEQPVWTGENISKPVASRRGSRGKWDSAVFFCWHVLWEASQKRRCFLGLYESHKTERLFWIYYIETYNYIHLSEHHTYILYKYKYIYTEQCSVFLSRFLPPHHSDPSPKNPDNDVWKIHTSVCCTKVSAASLLRGAFHRCSATMYEGNEANEGRFTDFEVISWWVHFLSPWFLLFLLVW